jgi:hypothetical protein
MILYRRPSDSMSYSSCPPAYDSPSSLQLAVTSYELITPASLLAAKVQKKRATSSSWVTSIFWSLSISGSVFGLLTELGLLYFK